MERGAEVGAPFEAIGQAIFRPIFTLPFSEPISCGFFFGTQEHPDARIGSFVVDLRPAIPADQPIDSIIGYGIVEIG